MTFETLITEWWEDPTWPKIPTYLCTSIREHPKGAILETSGVSILRYWGRNLFGARPSTSLLPLVPTSPSPWTPGVRQQAQWSRRRQAPQPWGGMQGGERNTSRGRKSLQKWNQLKKWKLFLMLSPVTSVTTNQPLRRDWSSTREWSTKHHSQRRAWGKVKRVQWASLPPSSYQ